MSRTLQEVFADEGIRVVRRALPTRVSRDAATGQSVVTLFVRPGESDSVRVPKDEYYLMDACGPLWYGEQAMFAAIGYYEKTESITIKGSKYYHVIELDSDKGGNLESYQSSPFEFSLSPRVGAQT